MDEAREEMTSPEDGSYRLFVGGAWRPAGSGELIEERSPIDDRVVGRIAAATVEDTDEAVEAAGAAWPAWEEAGFSARAEVLDTAAELMRGDEDEGHHAQPAPPVGGLTGIAACPRSPRGQGSDRRSRRPSHSRRRKHANREVAQITVT